MFNGARLEWTKPQYDLLLLAETDRPFWIISYDSDLLVYLHNSHQSMLLPALANDGIASHEWPIYGMIGSIR